MSRVLAERPVTPRQQRVFLYATGKPVSLTDILLCADTGEESAPDHVD
jgi:hypothetical protein